MYPPPKNGALACLNRKDDDAALFCQVSCKDGTDFVFLPAMLYVCPYSGNWLPYSHFASNPRLPWPDCASKLKDIPLYLHLLPNIRSTEGDGGRGLFCPRF